MDPTRGRRRTVDEVAADRAVLAALKRRKGVATRADVVVDTGLPEMVVERALERLLDRYASSVGVRKGGVLVYKFDPRFRARPERRPVLRAAFGAAAAAVRQSARAVRTAFRAVLALQLLVTTFVVLAPVSVAIGIAVGLAIAVMLVVGAIASGDGDVLELLVHPELLVVLAALSMVGGVIWVLKKKVSLLLAVVGRDPGGAGGIAGFIKQISDFALGPPRARRATSWADPTRRVSLDDEKIVLARVRLREGRLRTVDLVRWLGLSFEEADRQATRIAVEYGGEPAAVADVEVVEFTFPSLLPSAGEPTDALEAATRDTSFERGTRPPELTGNAPREDAFIAAFAGLNLAAGLAVLALVGDEPGWWRLAWWAGGVVPVGFSLLLFTLYALRTPVHLLRRALARHAARRERLIRAILAHAREHGDAPLDLARLDAPAAEVRRVALALEGRFDLDESIDPPRTVWRFDRLAAELRHAPPEPDRPAATPAPARPPRAARPRRRAKSSTRE